MTAAIQRTVSFKDTQATQWDGPHSAEFSASAVLNELAYLIATGADITAEYDEPNRLISGYTVRARTTDHVHATDFDITFRFTPATA